MPQPNARLPFLLTHCCEPELDPGGSKAASWVPRGVWGWRCRAGGVGVVPWPCCAVQPPRAPLTIAALSAGAAEPDLAARLEAAWQQGKLGKAALWNRETPPPLSLLAHLHTPSLILLGYANICKQQSRESQK